MIRIRKGMPETLLPVLLVFFIMGFVDITAIAVNYVKADFKLTDTVTNFSLYGFYLVSAVFRACRNVNGQDWQKKYSSLKYYHYSHIAYISADKIFAAYDNHIIFSAGDKQYAYASIFKPSAFRYSF